MAPVVPVAGVTALVTQLPHSQALLILAAAVAAGVIRQRQVLERAVTAAPVLLFLNMNPLSHLFLLSNPQPIGKHLPAQSALTTSL